MTDKFNETYFRALKAAKDSRGFVFCGFTSDLDRLIKWDARLLSELSREAGASPPEKPRTFVHTPKELLSDIIWYCCNGVGGELDIREGSLCEWINERFDCTDSIGGTGVQAASALSAAGMNALCHLSDSSVQLLKLLVWPQLKLLRNAAPVRASEAEPHGEAMCHYILQFDKGDELLLNGRGFVIPASNRIIITYDTLNEDLIIDFAYADYLRDHGKNCVSALISGFNCVTPMERMLRRIDETADFARRVKAPIYLEDAHYHEDALHECVYKNLAPLVDIMGMNEDEFSSALRAFRLPSPASKAEFIAAAKKLRELLATKMGLLVHTRDFAMYIGDKTGLTPDMALCLGNTMGTTRARLGRYGSFSDLEQTLELPLSETGIEWAREAANDKDVVLIPSRVIEKPACTVGLGDCFTAGVQALLRASSFTS